MYHAALVLEGGAMRGIYTGGVLDYLMEQDCWLDYVIGVSVGSSNAVDYISEQIGRTRDCIALTDDSLRYIHTKPLDLLKHKEMFDLDMLYNRYPNELKPFDYETYFHSDIACDLVMTSCLSGQAVYLDERADRKRLMDLVAASSSMPYVSHPVVVDGVPYLDGGVGDAVPVIHAMKKGYRKIVLVLTRPKGYRKKADGKTGALNHAIYRRYPKLAATLDSRELRYNRIMDLVDKWEEEGRIFVLRPEYEISRTEQDYDTLMDYYDHGYYQMEERFSDLMEYLNR